MCSRFGAIMVCISFLFFGCSDPKTYTADANTTALGSAAPAILFAQISDPTTVALIEAECALQGGIALYAGLDQNGDGVLESNEYFPDTVEQPNPLIVCHGQNGYTSLIAQATEPQGAQCAAGGIAIHSGLDLNRDAVLDANETTETSYLCLPETNTTTSTPTAPATLTGTIAGYGGSFLGNLIRFQVVTQSGELWLTPDDILSAVQAHQASTNGLSPQAPIKLTVDSEGRFNTQVSPGTNYTLTYINGTEGKKINRISLPGGVVTTQNIDTTAPNGGVRLRIVDRTSGTPLETATATLLDTNLTATADIDGTLGFSNLPAGTYGVIIHEASHLSYYLRVDISSGIERDLGTVELGVQKGSIRGFATLDGESEFSNIVVYAKASDGTVYTTLTSANGLYTFDALPVASGYSVIATAQGYQSAKYDTLTVTENQTTDVTQALVLRTAASAAGTIEGFARFEDRTALDHAGLIVALEGTNYATITARDGSFVLNGIPEGNYTVNFTDSNYLTTTRDIAVVAGAATRQTDVTLVKKRILSDVLDDLTLQSTLTSYRIDLTPLESITGTITYQVSSTDPSIVSATIQNGGTLILTPQGTVGQSTTVTVQTTSDTITDNRAFTVTIGTQNILWPKNGALATLEDTPLTILETNDTLAAPFVITPTAHYYGTQTIPNGTRTWEVTWSSVNDAPQLSYTPLTEALGNTRYDVNISVWDADADDINLTVTLLDAPDYAQSTIENLSNIKLTIYCNEVNASIPPTFETTVPIEEQNSTGALVQGWIDTQTPHAICAYSTITSFTWGEVLYAMRFEPDRIGTYTYTVAASDGVTTTSNTHTIEVTSAWQDFNEGFFSFSSVFGAYDAVMIDEKIYAAYGNFFTASKLELMEHNGTHWLPLTAQGLREVPSIKQIQLNTWQGKPYLMVLADTDPGSSGGDVLDVYSYDGTQWAPVGGSAIKEDITSGEAYLFVDHLGVAVALKDENYYNIFNGTSSWDVNTTVFRLHDESWQNVASLIEDTYAQSKVLIDGDAIYVLKTATLEMQRFNGSTWEPIAFTGSTPISFKDTDIYGGMPTIAYMPDYSDGNVTVMRYENSTWTTLGAANFAPVSGGRGLDLRYIGAVPYIAYSYDNDTSFNMQRFVNGAWERVGVPVSLHDFGAWNARTILANFDKPYVLFDDWKEDGKVYLRMIHYADTAPELKSTTPTKGGSSYATQPLSLFFDQAILSADVVLQERNGTEMNATVAIEGSRIDVTPAQPLSAASTYEVVVNNTLGAKNSTSLFESRFGFGVQSSQGVFKNDPTTRGVDHNYTIDRNLTVKDNVTGLMWDDLPTVPLKTWSESSSYCSDLSHAGYTDWRLPTFEELYTLADTNQSSATTFAVVDTKRYWSATRTPYYNMSMYELTRTAMSLKYGFYSYSYISETLPVKCVRGTAPARYMTRDDLKQIVIDHKHGLMWQDDSTVWDYSGDWNASNQRCEDLTLGGYTNWKMPTLNELVSITNLDRFGSGYDSSFVQDTGYYHWTSTLTANALEAWLVYIGGGSSDRTGTLTESGRYYTRCVHAVE